MEHVRENIFRWEGKSNRTPEGRRVAAKQAEENMKKLIESDPFIQAQRAAWKNSRKRS